MPEMPAPENESRFTQTALRLGRVTDEKHAAYGKALEKVPRLLAILLEDVPDSRMKSPWVVMNVQAISRILEKFCRILAPEPMKYGENPWSDVAGYAVGYATLTEELHAQTVQAQTVQPVQPLGRERAAQARRDLDARRAQAVCASSHTECASPHAAKPRLRAHGEGLNNVTTDLYGKANR
ncbi:hypothetical protein [Deinococcus kurensis]|uniref:hypothetical protein n=1 Tax=Deinococcus kurensis TaxID=2662757 RepID=UPI0012D2EB3E|nr:hypothetical protein [Deinococcus kurensis]